MREIGEERVDRARPARTRFHDGAQLSAGARRDFLHVCLGLINPRVLRREISPRFNPRADDTRPSGAEHDGHENYPISSSMQCSS
jgi:hypothetical protein